ncbi:MAG: hypothetical protein GXY64_05465 [Bacteroidales bacterium]|nr:hypothetical protein [Bacteroidales bacterium]
MKKILLTCLMLLGLVACVNARTVMKLGSTITFEQAKTTTEPFVIVQNSMVLCGAPDNAFTFKPASELEGYSYTFKFEEEDGNYYMRLYDQESNSKGYVNASEWSHTYISGIDKSGTKGEKQNGALWTIASIGEKKYSIRNLGVSEGNYAGKPNADSNPATGGYLYIVTSGYWVNHACHSSSTPSTWEFYSLETETMPDEDPVHFGWDKAVIETADGVSYDEETQFVRDARGWAPYWATSAQWKIDEGFDASEYRYLVFYTKRNAIRWGNGDTDTGGSLFISDGKNTFRGDDYVKYKNSAEVEKEYPAHEGKMWMNFWNEQRATYVDLQWLANTNKYGDGSECKVLDITNIKAFGFGGDFAIGGAYFTNVLPNISNGDHKISFTETEKFGTICLPFNSVCCGAEIYDIVAGSASGISLAKHKGVMEAGKPYIYKTLEAKKNQWGSAVDETDVYFYKAGYQTTKTAGESNGLMGTFTNTTAPVGSYVISQNKIWNVTSPVSVKKNKAYIDMSKIETISSAKIVFEIGNVAEEATGVNSIEIANSLKNGKIYDLSGREVSDPTRGLYIINGKKVMIK